MVAAKSSILRKKAHLLLMSTDIAVNTREELLAACCKTGIEWAQWGTRFELGQAVGKPYRVAVTVNDRGFAMAIKKQLERSGDKSNNGMGVVQ